VGCWTSGEEVPATEGQQEGAQHHSTQQAAKDSNRNQQPSRGKGLHHAPLHAASFAREQQQLELAQSNEFCSGELTRAAPLNTVLLPFSATVILTKTKDHHNCNPKTAEH